MVRFVLFSIFLTIAGCNDPSFREPIKQPPHGAAVRANMAAHIINPIPPGRTPTIVDAQRAVLATEKYRAGEVDEPGEKKPKSLTGAEE